MRWNVFDSISPCPKCGSVETIARYCCGEDWLEEGIDAAWPCPVPGQIDHLDRRCKRCEYTWPQEPLDAKDRKP